MLPTRPFNRVWKSQAQRIIEKFGGVGPLAEAMRRHLPADQCVVRSTINRWTRPRDKGGTGGLIPTGTLPAIRKAAHLEGIVLDDFDLSPDMKWVEELVFER